MNRSLQPAPAAPPRDPIAAVTHIDPYSYYADLVAGRPIYRDEALGLWVATSAEAVTAVLTHEFCRVRPVSEPVPRALEGAHAGEIFRNLVRMNDGPGHAALKPAVSRALAAMDVGMLGGQSRAWAETLVGELDLTEFIFSLSAYVIGSLIGVPRSELAQAARWTGEFVYCLSPISSSEQMERGKVAAGQLLELMHFLHKARSSGAGEPLLGALATEATNAGRGDASVIAANGVGMLSQAYEATAGLIGNSLLALARHGGLRGTVTDDPNLVVPFVQEVLRIDSPVQNTRRYVARPGTVAGKEMKEGDAVLVVLAAANRDPSANPEPERFDMVRKQRRVFTFGAGSHACPGETLAITIASAGVAQLMRSGLDFDRLADSVTYRASVNTRVPLFNT